MGRYTQTPIFKSNVEPPEEEYKKLTQWKILNIKNKY